MTVKQSAAQIHTFYIIKDFGTFCNAESSDFLSLWNKSYFLHKMWVLNIRAWVWICWQHIRHWQ